jgi:hypothetical protein
MPPVVIRCAHEWDEAWRGCSAANLIGDPPQLMTALSRDPRIRENAEALGHPTA